MEQEKGTKMDGDGSHVREEGLLEVTLELNHQ